MAWDLCCVPCLYALLSNLAKALALCWAPHRARESFYLIALTQASPTTTSFLFCSVIKQHKLTLTASSGVKWDAFTTSYDWKKGESMTYSSDSVAVQDLGEKKEEIFFKSLLSGTK